MNVEFHYYMVNYIARQAGFNEEDAEIIAYSSQFVDNALYPYIIETETGDYYSAVTQNFSWWEEESTWNIYVPFHFFPGENHESIRRDGRTNPFNCLPDNPYVKKLLIEALNSKNLYRIGIALHTYADTFAHQNFSGKMENWNRKELLSLIPAVGHAQFVRLPDDVNTKWEDSRLKMGKQLIDNKKRFREAAKMIYRYLSTYNGRKFTDEELILDSLFDMVGSRNTEFEERIQNYQIYAEIEKYHANKWKNQAFILKREPGNYDQPAYDKLVWVTQKLFGKIRQGETRRQGRTGFYDSHYYKWNEAAREQRKSAWKILDHLIPDEVKTSMPSH